MAKKVPPDGGYGWIIVMAYALNNVVVLPLITNFGLIFQEAFAITGYSATKRTLVVILHHSIGSFFSFFQSPALGRFGYRKVAVFGAITITVGLIMTSWATEYWQFILWYSLVNSFGVAAVMAAVSLAINSYFKEKRTKAIGLGMSVTGLGGILMPKLVDILMYAYGWRYAVLILSSICLHSLVAALLLRPVKWYLTKPKAEEMVPLKTVEPQATENTTTELQTEDHTAANGDLNRSASIKSLTENTKSQSKNEVSHANIQEEKQLLPKPPSEVEIVDEKKKSFISKIVNFYDLTLLKDPLFINLLIGLSVASSIETSFSLMLPYILRDMVQFETKDIAYILSTIAFSDTMFRFVTPFLGDWCRKSPRVVYTFSLIMIIIIRTVMLFTTSFVGMLIVALAMGITKAVRTIYMNTIIPNYVSIERLSYASGIQMACNGIAIMVIGALVGQVRDHSSSYHIPIVLINFITLITVLLWTGEYLYFKMKKIKSSSRESSTNQV